jgi:hypothetical protein
MRADMTGIGDECFVHRALKKFHVWRTRLDPSQRQATLTVGTKSLSYLSWDEYKLSSPSLAGDI